MRVPTLRPNALINGLAQFFLASLTVYSSFFYYIYYFIGGKNRWKHEDKCPEVENILNELNPTPQQKQWDNVKIVAVR